MVPDAPELVTPLDLFTIDKGGVYEREVCDGCPVRQECLRAALADAGADGVVGQHDGAGAAAGDAAGGGLGRGSFERVPSTQKIIEDCRKIRDVAEMIREQSPIPEVPDLAELFGATGAGGRDLSERDERPVVQRQHSGGQRPGND